MFICSQPSTIALKYNINEQRATAIKEQICLVYSVIIQNFPARIIPSLSTF